jgi:hypothetical protein
MLRLNLKARPWRLPNHLPVVLDEIEAFCVRRTRFGTSADEECRCCKAEEYVTTPRSLSVEHNEAKLA